MTTQRIVFEENDERVKITIPLKRQTAYWGMYSTMLAIWIIGSIWGAAIVIGYIRNGNFGFEGVYLYAYFVILLAVAIFWWYLGQKVWKQWQYFRTS